MRPANFIVPAYARIARAAVDAHQSPGRSFGHDRRMKTFLFASSLALCAGLATAQNIGMKEHAGLRFACGGAGFEKRAELASLRPQANLELLFITAKRGGYLADVEVAVFAADKGSPVLQVTAEGPMCMISPPAARRRRWCCASPSHLGTAPVPPTRRSARAGVNDALTGPPLDMDQYGPAGLPHHSSRFAAIPPPFSCGGPD
jgi:hypothetical protein